MLRQFLLVPGILHDPSTVDSWVDNGVAWIHQNTPDRAECYEYHSPATLRFLRQARRVRDVMWMCCRHPNRDLVLVGHSNGAALIVEALKAGTRAAEIHLIAGAAEADFEKNGLNDAVAKGRVRSINLYCSRSDRVLKEAAGWSRRLFGWAGLGYGDVGLVGPRNMSDAAWHVTKTTWRDGYGHSDYVGKNFTETMCLVTGVNFSPPGGDT